MERPEDGGCAGRARDREATRQRILDSARELFTSEGYAQVSSRRIAAHAGVNVALINRYFGAKRGLLAEVIAEEAAFPGIVEGGREGLPRRLAEHLVHRTLAGGTPLARALEHSAGDPDLKSVHEERLKNAMIGPLAEVIGGPEARARAALAASVILGVGLVRRIEGAAALQELDPDRLVDRLASVISACLAESAPGQAHSGSGRGRG
ncbi:TetR/AcrR family transcriptional regulator [Nocardiopsis suaedae]|uniref:TetR family transcriptional regulator n=1 Tax=Nocardiopsis suaedae TaxID=3018444 RepID=A0ABT4TWN0_9ACTN|nr:TetR/AcrR family transcriptional regulator [Nocardiopsis suaedae]MDA2808527.1 TetR family transcriptional regulator [Nocardiopsis suaedae]